MHFVGSLLINKKLDVKYDKYSVCTYFIFSNELLVLQIVVANIIDMERFGSHLFNSGKILAYAFIVISIVKDDSL